MAEYIEREKIWPALNAACVPYNRATQKAIESIPSADVRPVVYCRDCKHSSPWYSDKSRCFLWHEYGIDVFNDGFCNYGKKREES